MKPQASILQPPSNTMDCDRPLVTETESSRSYYREKRPDPRTFQEKSRIRKREWRKANRTGRPRGRPPGQSSPTQVRWGARTTIAPDIPDFLVTPSSATTSAFVNHNPTNFFNLLDELNKYGFEVGSLITPISSSEVVQQNMNAYKSYFPNSNQDLVTVSLVYPISLLEEKFLLLEPRHPKSLTYNPIDDLVSIVKDLYAVWGCDDNNQGLLELWIKAVEDRDLSEFNKTFAKINAFFLHIDQTSNRIHEQFGDSLCQQAYYRVITPNMNKLTKYRIGSDAVYGEIIKHIPDVMIKEGRLTEASHFVDLGSGIGNMVCLMSIRTGCSSFGVELMAHPAALAEKFVQQSVLRAHACGLKTGKMQLLQADMLSNELVKKNIQVADLVLVNNRMFCPQTNESIAFLLNDLKDGAKVFTTAPLTTSRMCKDRPLTKRTFEDPRNIFRIEKRIYPADSVSWSNSEGPYYIHTVDRQYHKTRLAEMRT